MLPDKKMLRRNNTGLWAQKMKQFLTPLERVTCVCTELDVHTHKKRHINTKPQDDTVKKKDPSKKFPKPFSSITVSPYIAYKNGCQDLRRFLEEVGTDPKEARYWLHQFRRSSEKCQCHPFAVVQVEREVLDDPDMLESLASCLSFLQRNDMSCVIVHGHDIQESTDYHTFKEYRSRLNIDSMLLVSTLESHGSHARPLFAGSGIIEAEALTGFYNLGQVTKVNMDTIHWAMHTGHIPVIQSVGEHVDGSLLTLDVSQVTAELSAVLQPRKVIMVNNVGGLYDHQGEPIPNINLPCDTEDDHNTLWYEELGADRLRYIEYLLNALPQQSSVVITSASTLLTELFTHNGSGTFFKKGEEIFVFHDLQDVNTENLKELINRSFGKDLISDYFDQLGDKLHTLYLSEEYNAAAVVIIDELTGIPYLDKFAVSQIKQGEGTGEMLWAKIKKDFPQLFWRSRISNKINSWYFKRSDGSWSNGEWIVFWYGVSKHRETSNLIDYALDLDSSFTNNGTGQDNTLVE